jgi:diguanylate cyclase (GGDEF)-like protein
VRDGGLRSLLVDPPLKDRITWREGIHPRTLISQDRGLMARTFGTIYVLAALVGAVSLLVPDPGDRNDAALTAISLLVLLSGAAYFLFYRRTPMWAFYAGTAGGSLIIAAALAEGSRGAEGGYAVFYVWVVLLAFLFFSFRPAVLLTAFAATTYAVALIARDAEFTFNYVFGLVVVLGSAGAVVGLLRGRLERLNTDLASEASTDVLTGVANRRGFDQRFEHELARAGRYDRMLSLIVCDLDKFKTVNDELGHQMGDDALRRVAARIAASVRSIDAVSRIGGEEFAILLPEATPMEAYVVAERIRKGLLDEFIDHPVPLTASCGVATQRGDTDGRDLLRAADGAMYRAKRAGRNCTAVDGAEEAGYRLADSSTK